MKKKSKVSLLSILVVFAFTLSGCFIKDTKWPGFTIDYDSSEVTEPGPVENPDDQPPEGDDPNGHDHIYGDWQYDEVYHWKECTICGDVVDKAEHTLGYTDNDDDETHAIHCEICEYTSRANHEWRETSNEPATCTKDGETMYECSKCSATKTVTIDALGHSWSASWTNDTTSHWHVCTVCGEVEPGSTEAHSYGSEYYSDGSSGHYQKCTVCGYVTSTTGHNFGEYIYTDSGSTGHYQQCADCGYQTDVVGHTYGDDYYSDAENGHYHICEVCNYHSSDENHHLSYESVDDTNHHQVCSECTYTSENEPHIYSISRQNDASTHFIKCSVCDHEITQEHTFTETVTDPTCTDGGYTTYTCECGYSYEGNQTSPLGHDWSNWTSNGTSGENDTHSRTCSACGETETLPHDWTETGRTDATCTTDGEITYTCSTCNATKTESIPATGHDYDTSTWGGYDDTYHYHVCTICGAKDENSKEDHTLEYVNDEENGHYQRCTECEYTTSDENHDLSCVSDNDDTHHQECSECDYKTESEEHHYEIVVGSYTESGHTVKCSDCEHEMTINHEYTSVVTEPTCTEGGYTTYTCECGYSYTGDETNALGHEWGEWTDNGSDETHIRTCSRCQDTETQVHDYEVTNISDIDIPSATALYEYTCTVCGHVKNVTEEYVFDFATDSWEIINEVSTQGYASIYYNVGDTKTITIGDEEHDIRIIDFDHDLLSPEDADDSDDDDEERETAGMTIEMVDCLGTEYQLNSSGSYTSWENCDLKAALDGEIFESLPTELQEVIKGVQKKTNNGSGDATVSSSENNKLFLPAIAELYSEDGIKNTSDSSSDLSSSYHQEIYLQEGKQYAYYQQLIGDQDPKANCPALEKVVPGKEGGDVENGYWVRSPNSNSDQYVWRFGYLYEHDYCMYNDASPTVERGVSFMFCV